MSYRAKDMFTEEELAKIKYIKDSTNGRVVKIIDHTNNKEIKVK
jgi:hypothetical protein